MKYVILIMLLSTSIYANQAVDDINRIIGQRDSIENRTNPLEKKSDVFLKDYHFIFVFRSNCPHCHNFAPILKDFSKTFNIKVKSYSFDGPGISGFDSNPLTPELLQDLFLTPGFKTVVPALYLTNNETAEVYPVIFGEATPPQLAIRISELVKKIKEKHDA